jgi:transcription antitermination factor NusA-like protein
MVKTIDMQDMRYLNLFERIMRVRTRLCFKYNEMIIFCVPKQLITKAVGEKGGNIRKMSEILGKRIRIVAEPKGVQDAEAFIRAIVNPIMIKNVEINDNEVVANAGKNKAALIGRNKRRLLEMQKIISDFFGKEFRVA